MQAYCLRCRQHQEMKDPAPATTKRGNPAMVGKCAACSVPMMKATGVKGSSADVAGNSVAAVKR